MDLESLKERVDKEKEFILKFSNELENFLNNDDIKLDNIIGIEDILKDYKLNREYRREFFQERDKLLENYISDLKDGEFLYYINSYNSTSQKFGIIEYDKNGEIKNFYLSADNLPNGIKKGFVMKKEGDNFSVNKEATKFLNDKLIGISKTLSKLQEKELESYRKEGGIYQVIDNDKVCITLLDKETEKVFGEVKFSEELFNLLATDYIVRFENGEYIYDEKLTDEFFNSL